ncbi:MAG: PilN domain-containing protein [Pyrinomonadaceae bacterium]
MIKINLLNSVTERQGGAVVAVDRKISSPASRLLIMSLAVGFLLAAVIGWDVISTKMAKNQAEAELAEQKQIATELEAVLREQKELEARINNIDKRIDAIKKLRASQAGPSAVLEALRERIAMVPGLYLESVEQAGEQLTLKGNSPDEQAVTQFGRSLEFSSGLFSNLSIETQRKEDQTQQTAPSTNPQQSDANKLVLVGFSIKCAYTPSKSGANNQTQPTTAQNNQQLPSGMTVEKRPVSSAPVSN